MLQERRQACKLHQREAHLINFDLSSSANIWRQSRTQHGHRRAERRRHRLQHSHLLGIKDLIGNVHDVERVARVAQLLIDRLGQVQLAQRAG